MIKLSLFTGIYGDDLASEKAGIETVCCVEKDPYCQQIILHRRPGMKIIGDIRDVTKQKLKAVCGYEYFDIIAGGFPCQPFSGAGKRRGERDDRYLWPEMFRVIKEFHPEWVLAENVYGLINYKSGDILRQTYADLESEGYETLPPVVLPACGVNAPHLRYRVFIVAYHGNFGCTRTPVPGGQEREENKNAGRGGPIMADTDGIGPGGESSAGDRGELREQTRTEAVSCRAVISDSSGKSQRESPDKDITEPNGREERAESGEFCNVSDSNSSRSDSGTERTGREEGADAHRSSTGTNVADTERAGLSTGTGQGLEEVSGRGNNNSCPIEKSGVVPDTESTERDRNINTRGRGEGSTDGSQQGEDESISPVKSGLGGAVNGIPAWLDGNFWAGDWEKGTPRVVAKGKKNRVKRLVGLGNAVVPAQVYPFYKAIVEIDKVLSLEGIHSNIAGK